MDYFVTIDKDLDFTFAHIKKGWLIGYKNHNTSNYDIKICDITHNLNAIKFVLDDQSKF